MTTPTEERRGPHRLERKALPVELCLPGRPPPQLTNGVFRLQPGKSVTGTVTAVLPNGVKVVRVRWTASSGFGQAVAWHLETAALTRHGASAILLP